MLKENKFLIGLGVVTAAASGGLIFWGLGAGSDLETAQADIATKKAALKRMEALDPYPTTQNAKDKADSLAAVLVKAREARQKLLAFNPKSLEDIPGSEFSEKLKASVARVKELFPGEKGLPKEFQLGFEKYAQYPAPEGATGELAFQLDALEYLFTQLAEAGGERVVNVHRPPIPMEEGKPWPGEATPRRGSRGRGGSTGPRALPTPGGRRGKRGAANEILPDVAHRLPVEVTFKASEETARNFLTRIGDSDRYFFEVRLGRVENSAPIPAADSSAKGSATSSSSGDNGGIVVEEDAGGIVVEEDDGGADAGVDPAPEPLPEAPETSEKILNKVSGNETLDVFLKLDLLIFMEGKDFPQTK